MAYQSIFEDDGSAPPAEAPVQDAALPPPQATPPEAAPAKMDTGYKSIFDDAAPENALPPDAGEGEFPGAMDAVKSAAIGIPKGLISGLGAVGDARDFIGKGVGWVGSKLGLPEPPEDAPKPKYNIQPTSADIRSKVEGVTGKFYEPKTTLGHYLESASEFASNPLSYAGPGAVGAKAAAAAISGLGSEAGGQLGAMAGPEWETAGRMAGAVLAPGAVSVAKQAAPTIQELFKASDADYSKALNAPVVIKPQAFTELSKKIEDTLLASNIRERNAPRTWEQIKELNEPLPYGVGKLADVESIRKKLNQISGADGNAASKAIGVIDDFYDKLASNTHYHAATPVGGTGVIDDAVNSIKEARGNYAAAMRAKVLEKVLKSADLRTVTTGSGNNVENNLRKAVATVLRNDSYLKKFSPEEISTMRDLAQGSGPANAARWMGKFSPSGVVSSTLSFGIGHMLAGKLGAFSTPVVGKLSKMLGESIAKSKVDKLNDMARLRSPLGSTFKKVPPSYVSKPLAYGKRLLPAYQQEDESGLARGGKAINRAIRLAKSS